MPLPLDTLVTKGTLLQVVTVESYMLKNATAGDLFCQDYVDLVGTVVVAKRTNRVSGTHTILSCKGKQRRDGTYTYSLYAFELALHSVDWWDIWMKGST